MYEKNIRSGRRFLFRHNIRITADTAIIGDMELVQANLFGRVSENVAAALEQKAIDEI